MKNIRIKLAMVFIAVLLLPQTQLLAQTYVPPIGIPAPEFGIEESHMMYVGAQYDFGNGDEPYKDAGFGPYTHYIDNSVVCSDSSNNPFGTLDNPRCNIPLRSLAAGSVVEIHGGTYTSVRNWLTSSGTVDKPIFIRGYADPKWVIKKDSEGNPIFVQSSPIPMPVIERTLRVRGAYIIIENIDFNLNNRREGAVDIRPTSTDPIGSVHHVAVRNSEVQNYGYHSPAHTNNPGSLLAATGTTDNFVHDIVYYKNNIHPDNSFDDFNEDDDPVNTTEDDTIGVGITLWSNRVWVLDNHIHHTAGDALGTGHRANYTSRNYYIGRNIMNDCDENAVDIKSVENFVISQNIMYNFFGASLGSNGTAVVVHSGPIAAPINSWFIYNEIYNASDAAIQIGGEVLDDAYFIGNVIHNISNEAVTGSAFVSWGSDGIYVIHNTVYNSDRGVVFQGTRITSQAIIENNIFSQLKTEDYVRLSNSDYLDRAIIRNNIFHSDTFTPVVEGNSVNEINSDPLFVDPANNNFELRNTPASSAAIDSGFESSVYQLFQDRFGLDIRVDLNGTVRPSGSSPWDLGAFEFDEVFTDGFE